MEPRSDGEMLARYQQTEMRLLDLADAMAKKAEAAAAADAGAWAEAAVVVWRAACRVETPYKREV